MTEDQARAALAAFDGLGGLERWIAEQPWEPIPRGSKAPKGAQIETARAWSTGRFRT